MKRISVEWPGTRCLSRLLASLAILSSLMSILSGQTRDIAGPAEVTLPPSTVSSPAHFAVDSELVLVPVTVTAGHGRVVSGLSKEDFSVLEDNIPQPITHFTAEEAPATIGVVIDCSDSMAGSKLARAREAVYALLRTAKPEDEFFLVRFSTRPELTLGLTRQTEQIRRAIETLEARGFTALFDAVTMAWSEMSKAQHRRKAIVIISDGEDNHSRTTEFDFEQMAMQRDTTIYTLFIGDPMEPPLHRDKHTGAGLLDEIARRSGGRMFEVSSVKRLPKIAAQIGSWIRSQYVLGYVPPPGSRNGGYHRIQVTVDRPLGFPKMHSSWRLGYYAPAN